MGSEEEEWRVSVEWFGTSGRCLGLLSEWAGGGGREQDGRANGMDAVDRCVIGE